MPSTLGDFPSHHTWTENVAVVHCVSRVHQRIDHRTVTVDFDSMGISRGGILEQAIRDCPCPVLVSYATPFAQVVRDLASNAEARNLFGTPAQNLALPDIHHLFWLIENAIERRGGVCSRSRSYRARHIFQQCRQVLATGELVGKCGFKTRFMQDPPPVKNLLSEMYDKAFDDEELAAPISAIPFDTLSQRNEKAINHLETRLNRVTEECERMLVDYSELKATLASTKQSPPPSEIPKRMVKTLRMGKHPGYRSFQKLPEKARLWIATFLVERDHLYRRYLCKQLPLSGITCLESVCCSDGKKTLFTALLCDYYLPKLVLIACLLLIMAATAWNADTVLSMSRENVKKNKDGTYTISGIKSRTDQIQENILESSENGERGDISDEIDERDINDAYACKALDLLLWHDAQVAEYAKRTSDSMFVCLCLWNVTEYIFEIPRIARAIREFCDHKNLPYFRPSAIRDQITNLELLRTNGDIHYVSALLGHADIATTIRYLNSTIIKLLNEANMKRFMDHLAPSIIFACGGLDEVTRLNFNPKKVSEQMLFPPSAMSPENGESISDKWLNHVGDMPICITKAEIQHCALQMNFYRNHFRTLTQADDKRFRYFHLPRIIFCKALYEIISASQHRHILRTFEETINAA